MTKQVIFYIWTLFMLYYWGGYLTFCLLILIDKKVHRCLPEDIEKEKWNYFKASIFWVFTLPIVIVYLLVSLFEKITNKDVTNKETKVALISGSVLLIEIMAIIWRTTK